MIDNLIYSVVWWTGTDKKESTFLRLENADAFAQGAEKCGVLIARGVMRHLSPEQHKRFSRACIDYEPPKKI